MSHTHGAGAHLNDEARGILARGLTELLAMTEGLELQPVVSERFPNALARAVYAGEPDLDDARRRVREQLVNDPVAVLEYALVLLELLESQQADLAPLMRDDRGFLMECFNSKRKNGWACVMGGERAEVEAAVNDRWQFRFFHGPERPTNVYVLLNHLARYGFVYGRIEAGDFHSLGHFVEDYCPGVIVCRPGMSDLELTLSLAAMKMGVPAVVPLDYPFALGRTIRAEALDQVSEAIVGFPNVRRLLRTPDLPQMPSYCDSDNMGQSFETATVWGGTPNSFCVLRKGPVAKTGWNIIGEPSGEVGIFITVQAEPMDAFDREYIERIAVSRLSMMRGVKAHNAVDFRIEMAADVQLDPNRIGETLIAAIRREFPRLDRINVEIIFDPARLVAEAPRARDELRRRQEELDNATEATVDTFYTCVGCSPFAPDHVCCLTPERPPQCGRPYGMIKTGALYGYDDMSNIHHSQLHRDLNSFQVAAKGRLLDAERGEWEGVNAKVSELSKGRTRRVRLHSLDEVPHTGCGCFSVILFKTEQPRSGVAIMDRRFGGPGPDGRDWRTLHYALGGKQAPGIAGATPEYLLSKKFLRGHGGWKGVVWVSPEIADFMGEKLPAHVEIGRNG